MRAIYDYLIAKYSNIYSYIVTINVLIGSRLIEDQVKKDIVCKKMFVTVQNMLVFLWQRLHHEFFYFLVISTTITDCKLFLAA